MPEKLVPETRLERFLSSIVYNTDVPEERRNRLERWLGAILKRNLPPDAPYDRLERWLKEIYENADYSAQFSGLNVEFWSGSEGNVKSITLPIEYVQSGSGNPSPENVRPISGFTGVEVKRYGATEDDNLLTLDVPFNRTVYGGSVDAITGVLTVNHVVITLDGNENFGKNGLRFQINATSKFGDLLPPPNIGASSSFRLEKFSAFMPEQNGFLRYEGYDKKACVWGETGSYYFGAQYTAMETPSEFKNFLKAQYDAGTPVQALVPLLENATTFQLTPNQVSTLIGVNHVTAKLYNDSSSIDVNISVKV